MAMTQMRSLGERYAYQSTVKRISVTFSVTCVRNGCVVRLLLLSGCSSRSIVLWLTSLPLVGRPCGTVSSFAESAGLNEQCVWNRFLSEFSSCGSMNLLAVSWSINLEHLVRVASCNTFDYSSTDSYSGILQNGVVRVASSIN